jgi:hypothetical protein
MEIVHEATSFTEGTSMKAESFLLAELRHLNEKDSRICSESSMTLNVYLILESISAIAVGTLQIFAYYLSSQGYEKIPFVLDASTILLLVFGGIMSIIFLLRFIQVAQREFHNGVAANKIRAFYITYLKSQMPAIGEALPQQDHTEYASNVAFYIPYVVSLVGSLSFGGAIYILFENLFWSTCVFAIVFVLQLSYYHICLSRLKNEPDPPFAELGKQRETRS